MTGKPAATNGRSKRTQHVRELTILNRIAEALNSEVDLTRALNTVLSLVAELLDLQTGWVFLFDEESSKFYAAATQNLPPALANNPRRLGGTCTCLDTYREGDLEGAANINVISCSRLSNLVDGTDGLRYHASIPLYAHTKQLGVFNVASTDWRELSDSDLRLLHTVGDLLSMAIERARLFRQSVAIGAANERNRLAREIHDTIAQGLAGIALQLETADILLESQACDSRVHQAVRKALDMTRANFDEVRRSVLDLRAAPLENSTLVDALETLVTQHGHEAGFAPRLEVIGEGQPLPTRIEVGLYRIAQEALNNVVQHAQASHVRIQLTLTSDQVTMQVRDNGEGFDPETVVKGHFGLIGLSERARLLGGTLTIRSEHGVGTSIDVRIPLEGTS